jgi:hypothetical protein
VIAAKPVVDAMDTEADTTCAAAGRGGGDRGEGEGGGGGEGSGGESSGGDGKGKGGRGLGGGRVPAGGGDVTTSVHVPHTDVLDETRRPVVVEYVPAQRVSHTCNCVLMTNSCP